MTSAGGGAAHGGQDRLAEIRAREIVVVRTAFDKWFKRRALTAVVPGYDFPVVWVCSLEEWDKAQAIGQEPKGVPWPAEDVKPVLYP